MGVVCASNLDQLGLAAEFYFNDYDEHFLAGCYNGLYPGEYCPIFASNKFWWHLLPYFSSSKDIYNAYELDIFHCPSRKSLFDKDEWDAFGVSGKSIRGSGYAINFNCQGPWWPHARGRKLKHVRMPSQEIFFYEHKDPMGFSTSSGGAGSCFLGGTIYSEMEGELTDPAWTPYTTPHNGSQNILYIDGHVERISVTEMLDTAWTATPGSGGIAPAWGVYEAYEYDNWIRPSSP